jgi:hypothetical protein
MRSDRGQGVPLASGICVAKWIERITFFDQDDGAANQWWDGQWVGVFEF